MHRAYSEKVREEVINDEIEGLMFLPSIALWVFIIIGIFAFIKNMFFTKKDGK